MSSSDIPDDGTIARRRRSRLRRPWVSRRTLLVFWALWMPYLAFALLTPALRTRELHVPHAGEPSLQLSLVNGSRHQAALVIADEDTGARRIEWLPDTSRSLSDKARPGGRLLLSVVTSSLASGKLTAGEDDLSVPAQGTARLLVREDGSGTVLDPGEEPAGADIDALAAEADSGADAGVPDGSAPQPFGAVFVNGSARVLHGTFLGDDGARIEHFDEGGTRTVVASRALVAGEHLHASWELASPVTDGGTPRHVQAPGNLVLQVRVFPDGSWEIGEPSTLGLLRLKLAMFAAVFTRR